MGVPIVEPEILLDGEHDIDTTLEVASRTWAQTFKYLADQDVLFEGILLKPSMVTPGADSGTKCSPETVAEYTVLKTWQGDEANVDAAQAALIGRAKANSLAQL